MDAATMVKDEEALWEMFDIVATASFILRSGFQLVALQFPDDLLKCSVAVSSALTKELLKQKKLSSQEGRAIFPVRLFVMADTTFGSCCADEIAAMHVDAQCIVHYGHTCLSVTSRLPVWFVFGRATINAEGCALRIVNFAAGNKQPLLVMFGLQYSYAVQSIRGKVALMQKDLDITFVDTPSQLIQPSVIDNKPRQGCPVSKPTSKSLELKGVHDATVDTFSRHGSIDAFHLNGHDINSETSFTDEGEVTAARVLKCTEEGLVYNVGGLTWVLPKDRSMEDYTILWIGGDDPGLTNTSLLFNSSTVVRYDCAEDKIMTDVANQSRLLQRRYYVVERAKDANIVGIVVGTLGVAGYGDAIQRIRRMVEAAGKKAYTLVMGKLNPSKLANFPECEVFVLVACPQTALLDSKEYLAPIITPFEAELAFLEGKQWTGAYRLELATESAAQPMPDRALDPNSGPRFSFFTGSYVGKDSTEDRDVEDRSSRAVVLSNASQHALQLRSESSSSIITAERTVLDIKSGAEYLAARTYQGLDINQEGPSGPKKALLAVIGRTGRAAVYADEVTDGK